MKPLNITIGNIIRDHRIAKNLTQLDVSFKLGYSSCQFISLIERGLSAAPLEILGKLVIILEIPEIKLTTLLIQTYRGNLAKEISLGKEQARMRLKNHSNIENEPLKLVNTYPT